MIGPAAAECNSQAAAMHLSEDLQIELEALQATYDSALTVVEAGGGNRSSAANGTTCGGGAPGGEAERAAVAVELRLALVPQTGGEEAAVFVLATLGISVGSNCPQQPPTCSLIAAKGAACPCVVTADGVSS